VESESGTRIVRILGIPIYLHSSWFIIFALITLSLGTQFSAQYPNWSSSQHWALGIITSLFFFASVLVHELGHSLVARHYKIPVASITLFIFGGLAKISRDPERPGQEFNIAIAGPITSFVLAGAFGLVYYTTPAGGMLSASSLLLSQINLVLGLFNLVPGSPLDGGRILRSIAWRITRDFTKATRIAALSGQTFAYLLMIIGIYQGMSAKNWVGGLWLVFIGWFLKSAARKVMRR